jgi:4-amino-4-deoxy-L-arabinose transferase-like glycosyltransferase
VNLPAGTGRVRFAAYATRPRVVASVTVQDGRTLTSRAVGSVRHSGRIDLDAAIPPTADAPASVRATVCMTPRDGPIDVGGTAGLQADQRPAQLGGAPLASRVALGFLPAAGERSSLFAAAGSIFERAARFRPGIVGAWTYPLLLLVVLPLTWVLALVLMTRAADGRRTRVAPVVAIGLVAFLNAATWALITPVFEAPDEPDHFAYVQQLAETGRQPARAQGVAPVFSADETVALDGVRAYSRVGLGDARPPWLAADEHSWEHHRAAVAHLRDDGGGASTASAHSPLYYGLLAPAYLAVGTQSAFSQLTLARLASALFGALVAICAFGIVRELLPRQPFAAVGAGLLVAFQPMLTFMAGAVNNDTGVNAAAALTLYLTIRGLRRGLTWRLALGLGAALALTPLMKGTGFAIYPAVAVGLAGMAWRHHRRPELRVWVAGAATFAAIRGAWALAAPRFAHPGQGGGGGIAAAGSVRAAIELPGRYLEYLWQTFLPRLPFMPDLFPQRWLAFDVYVREGWGAFGWLTVYFPTWVYVAIALTMLACGALAGLVLVRERVAAAPRTLELAVIALVPICVVAAVTAAYFTPGGRFVPAEQGRYLFPAVAALATIAVGGTFGLGRRWHVPLLTALVVATIGLGYAARLLSLASYFA